MEIITIFLWAQFISLSGQTPPTTSAEVIWHWFGNCASSNSMRANVLLQKRSVYRTSFPVCRARRSDTRDDPAKILRFSFRADAKDFGQKFAALGTRQIEGNIWKAGGESDAILLGVSFTTRDSILLNTIHIVRPGKTTRTVLTDALSIVTSRVP